MSEQMGITEDNGESFEVSEGVTSLNFSITPNDDAIEVLCAEQGPGPAIGLQLTFEEASALFSWLEMMLRKHTDAKDCRDCGSLLVKPVKRPRTGKRRAE